MLKHTPLAEHLAQAKYPVHVWSDTNEFQLQMEEAGAKNIMNDTHHPIKKK